MARQVDFLLLTDTGGVINATGMQITSHADLAAHILRGDGRVHIAAHMDRIGAAALFAAVEWYWYAPNTSRNRFYDISLCEWRDMRWAVMSFPAGRLHAVQRLAKQIGLRIADGPPIMLGRAGGVAVIQATSRPSRLSDFRQQGVPIDIFPGGVLPDGRDNLSIFTVEYDKGNPAYETKRQNETGMHEAGLEVNEALNRGVRLTPLQIADYIYGSGDFPKVDEANLDAPFGKSLSRRYSADRSA